MNNSRVRSRDPSPTRRKELAKARGTEASFASFRDKTLKDYRSQNQKKNEKTQHKGR